MGKYRETLTFDVEAAEWTGRNSAEVAAVVGGSVTVAPDGTLTFTDRSDPAAVDVEVKQGDVVVRYLTGQARIKVISKDEFHRAFTKVKQPKAGSDVKAATAT